MHAAAVECGLPNLYAAGSRVRWRDAHRVVLAYWHAVVRFFAQAHASAVAAAAAAGGISSSSSGADLAAFVGAHAVIGSSRSPNDNVTYLATLQPFLAAYVALYTAMRKGHWALRNAAISRLAVMFFAYNKPKYMEVVARAMVNKVLLPAAILQQFEQGEWTVSFKGQPNANVALDEALEMGANKGIKTMCGRASTFRVQALAAAHGWFHQAVGMLRSYAFKHDAPKSSKHDRSEHAAANGLARLFAHLHSAWATAEPLQAASSGGQFGRGAALADRQREELLHPTRGFQAVGQQRLHAFIRQWVIKPPLDRPVKPSIAALHTFAPKTRAGRRPQNKQKQLQKDKQVLMRRLHQISKQPVSVFRTPQALSNPDGSPFVRQKSAARGELLYNITRPGPFTAQPQAYRTGQVEALLNAAQPLLLAQLQDAGFSQWLGSCNSSNGGSSSSSRTAYAVVVDGLGLLHKPPSPNCTTFGAWYKSMLQSGIYTHLQHGATTVVFIIDNPDDLPPPRQVLHARRAEAAAGAGSHVQPPDAAGVQPHMQLLGRKQLQAWLSDPAFKAAVVQAFTTLAQAALVRCGPQQLQEQQCVLLDTPATATPWGIRGAAAGAQPRRLADNDPLQQPHHKGETDLSAWWFAARVPEAAVLLQAADTDWLFYGLALYEACPGLQSKQLVIHHQAGNALAVVHEYEHLNEVHRLLLDKLAQHHPHSAVQQPAAQLLFTYLMSGSDYIPGFKFVPFIAWFVLLLTEYAFVTDSKVSLQPTAQAPPADHAQQQQQQQQHMVSINANSNTVSTSPDSAARLVSAHYYNSADKQGRLFAEPLADVYADLQRSNPLPCNIAAVQDLLAGTDASIPGWPATLAIWLDLVARFSWTRMGSDDRTMPPPRAVYQQLLRTCYVTQLVLEAVNNTPSSIKSQHLQHGWQLGADGKLGLNWGIEQPAANQPGRPPVAPASSSREHQQQRQRQPAAATPASARAAGTCACKRRGRLLLLVLRGSSSVRQMSS
jgi:hypothetical protein